MGWEALPESQEKSGGPGEVGRHSLRAGLGLYTLPESQEGLGGPSREPGGSRGLGGVGMPSKRSARGREG